MKIGVIIPDRGDRPEFLENCLRMLSAQTVRPTIVKLMNMTPRDEKVDITWRYKMGYMDFNPTGKNYVDVIAFIENDDWYHPEYLETMSKAWVDHGKPDIFGTNYSIYFNLKLKKWIKMYHDDRSAAMNTLIKPRLKIHWPPDHEPYTDLHLWQQLKGVTFSPEKIISMGIKHNVGMTGGHYHSTKLHKFTNEDDGFMEKTMDAESFEFYSTVQI